MRLEDAVAQASLVLALGIAALVIVGLVLLSLYLQRRTERRLASIEQRLRGLSKSVVDAGSAVDAIREEARAAAETTRAMFGEMTHSLVDRLEAGRRSAAADAEASRTLVLDLARASASRHDSLVGQLTASAAASDPAAVREAEERAFFQHTLATARIRALQLTQLLPGIEAQAVEIGVIDPDTRHPNHVDMLYVCAIARHLRSRRVFEFGTFLGRTTYHLARGAHVERVFTLDLDPSASYPPDLKIGRAVKAVRERHLQGHFFRDDEARRRVTQLHGDSRTFDYTPYRGLMDFIFVDGGHTYDLVVNDTKHAFSLLTPGGVIVWHDFAPKGRDVTAFARELSSERPLFWIQDTSLLVYLDGVDPMTYEAAPAPYSRSVIKPE